MVTPRDDNLLFSPDELKQLSHDRVWPKIAKIAALCLLVIAVGIIVYINRVAISHQVALIMDASQSTKPHVPTHVPPTKQQQQAALQKIQEQYCQPAKEQLATDQGKLSDAQQELAATQQELVTTEQTYSGGTAAVNLIKAIQFDITSEKELITTDQAAVNQDTQYVNRVCN